MPDIEPMEDSGGDDLVRHGRPIWSGTISFGLVSVPVQLVSGNPYSPTNLHNPPEQIPWGGTLPPFFQLDVRADRTWHRAWGDIDFFLDIQNVTNRRNVEGREYGYDDAHPNGADLDTPGLPIVPFLGVDFIPR